MRRECIPILRASDPTLPLHWFPGGSDYPAGEGGALRRPAKAGKRRPYRRPKDQDARPYVKLGDATRDGGFVWRCDGYEYTISKVRPYYSYVKCRFAQKFRCTASAKIMADSGLFFPMGNHTCKSYMGTDLFD